MDSVSNPDQCSRPTKPKWTKEEVEKEVLPLFRSVLSSISGSMGGMTFVTDRKGRMSIRNRPVRKAPPGPLQLKQQKKFKRACAWAKQALHDPALKSVYEATAARKRMSPYNVAVQDYLNPPEIS